MVNIKTGVKMDTDKYTFITIFILSISILLHKILIESGLLYIDIGIIIFLVTKSLSDYKYSKSKIIITYNKNSKEKIKISLTKSDILKYIDIVNKNSTKRISNINLPININDLAHYIKSNFNHINDLCSLKEELGYILAKLNSEEQIRFINGIISKNRNFLKCTMYRIIYDNIIYNGKFSSPKNTDDVLKSNGFITPNLKLNELLSIAKNQYPVKIIILGKKQKYVIARKIKSFSTNGSILLNSIICDKVLLYQIY